jgi:predicted dehydrogenase
MTRVAVIGAGYFCRFHLEGWANVNGAQVVGLCDTDKDKAEELGRQFGVDAIYDDASGMLAQINADLIDIVTPPPTHLALVELAIQHQLPAICQKPLAPTVAEATQIVATARQAKQLLVVHENFRFSPWYREARRLVDQRVLGDIHSVAFRLRPGDGQGPDAYLARQPYFQQMPRFLVHETAIHFIDTFRYLVGEVSAVTARLRRVNPAIAGEDAGYIIFEFEHGQSGLFDGNRLNEHPASDLRRTMGEMWLEGSAGVLRLDGNGSLFLKKHGEPELAHEYDSGTDSFAGGAATLLQQHVIDHLNGNGEIENEAFDYLRNIQIEQAVYESSDRGKRIELGSA